MIVGEPAVSQRDVDGVVRRAVRNRQICAADDKQTAVFGDEGIYQRVGEEYWKGVVRKMVAEFRQEHLVDGICTAITRLGEALAHHFPYNRDTDKNELPDEIVFGR